MREEELLQKLREAFQAEAGERLASLFAHLEQFEKSGAGDGRAAEVEILFREAHSLKGAARAVNLGDVERLCQALEGVFSRLKKGDELPQNGLCDLFYDVASFLEELICNPNSATDRKDYFQGLLLRLAAVEEGVPVPSGVLAASDEKPLSAVEGHSSVDEPVFEPAPPIVEEVSSEPARAEPETVLSSSTKGKGDTVRVATSRIDELMLVAEEFITVKLSLSQYAVQLSEILCEFSGLERRRRELRSTAGFAGEGDSGRGIPASVQKMVGDLKGLVRRLNEDQHLHAGLVDDLLDRVRSIAMLPLDSLFAPLPRMVRELSRELGKRVDFAVSGGSIEVDRRVLEEMKDPLIHLLRNALDHGIETADGRLAAGKDPVARIRCVVSQSDASSIDIMVADDGRGLDPEAIREKAVTLGLLDASDSWEQTDEKICDLIFNSGFSTSPIITEISGRGLGMAIVREKIENLGGWIRVANCPGQGCEFHLHLPVTVAISRGILVLAGGRKFVFPSLKIDRVVLLEAGQAIEIEGRKSVEVEGDFLPLLDLARLLRLTGVREPLPESRSQFSLVVIGRGSGRRALLVDQVLGEQEILVKGLGPQLISVSCVEGATILGSGEVVPILKVPDLLEIDSAGAAPEAATQEENKPARLLVVDDSITSRMLIKNILEAAGYQVEIAVDGRVALELLQNEGEEFDLVVSDVEMPFVDGFALTEALREDEKLAEMPVVLVTSLGSREDRERGVAAGADAYIVKGEFDQQNLLEVVKSLVQ